MDVLAQGRIGDLQPLHHPKDDCWLSNRPTGHNPLSQTVKKLVERVGIKGHYTNHSLRRTCATRLYNRGADKQQIMSITGHRSIDAMRMYKQISHDQQEELSNLIQPNKKPKIDEGATAIDKNAF